ncbi:MAG: ABC transporter substrate-binding protein [Deltaproteobacteria bacterium]|nr:ABC transporter substrate-binding protein [Deltaproteobacteria bacterium]
MRLSRSGAAIAVLLLAISPGSGCRPERDPHVLRLGYAPNLTHAQALVGLARGEFDRALPAPYRLEPMPFNAGPAIIEALFAGELDMAYVGPVPAINGFVQSRGRALHIVSGSASGGSGLAVREGAGIESEKDLEGRGIAVPQFGGTQDVALRSFLAERGFKTYEHGGSVRVLSVPNPETITLFKQGQLDAAMVPEPWLSRLILQAGARLLVDERSLWPGGRYATTVIVARQGFMKDHPAVVRALLEAHVGVTDWIGANPEQAVASIRAQVASVFGKALPEEIVSAGLSRVEPLVDPLWKSIEKDAQNARALGYLKRPPELAGLIDLAILNGLLDGMGRPRVSAGPLGTAAVAGGG